MSASPQKAKLVEPYNDPRAGSFEQLARQINSEFKTAHAHCCAGSGN
jgi:hypothetical protein